MTENSANSNSITDSKLILNVLMLTLSILAHLGYPAEAEEESGYQEKSFNSIPSTSVDTEIYFHQLFTENVVLALKEP